MKKVTIIVGMIIMNLVISVVKINAQEIVADTLKSIPNAVGMNVTMAEISWDKITPGFNSMKINSNVFDSTINEPLISQEILHHSNVADTTNRVVYCIMTTPGHSYIAEFNMILEYPDGSIQICLSNKFNFTAHTF
ncbi:MAG: hypothetical protein NT068_01105 [Candidatus Nomurabacteria bacterium]|nr:hypothetical protein [Candidatus Nomurabacteria bacterium]